MEGKGSPASIEQRNPRQLLFRGSPRPFRVTGRVTLAVRTYMYSVERRSPILGQIITKLLQTVNASLERPSVLPSEQGYALYRGLLIMVHHSSTPIPYYSRAPAPTSSDVEPREITGPDRRENGAE